MGHKFFLVIIVVGAVPRKTPSDASPKRFHFSPVCKADGPTDHLIIYWPRGGASMAHESELMMPGLGTFSELIVGVSELRTMPELLRELRN